MRILKTYEDFSGKPEIQVEIPNLDHLLRHTEEDITESGSKMSKDALMKGIDILKQRIKSGDFDESKYVNDPARYVKLVPGGIVGKNALMEGDENTANVWDREFEKATQLQPGQTMNSEIDRAYLWQMRENAEIPVLVKLDADLENTSEITCIVGPESGGKVPVWAMFPGPPAPRINMDSKNFWRTHYFAGKGLKL